MNFQHVLRTLVVCCAFAATQAGAAILQVNGAGILTGATGVTVNGVVYNVTFAAGSCNSVFDYCSASAFAFSEVATAALAAQALLDQVMIDGPAGQFDSAVNKILGCTGTLHCMSYVPYGDDVNSRVNAIVANNFVAGASVGDQLHAFLPFDSELVSGGGEGNYAVFTRVQEAAVPEPGSISLIGLALAGLAFVKRRRQHRA